MATSDKDSITIQKDIQIQDFRQGNTKPNSAIFYHVCEPFCEVFVNPVGRSNPDFVSVRVARCTFYPHFLPGLVYGSLGWKASVVDAEGAEKFVTYFGHEDFRSLDWVEDLFSDRGYELEGFVDRSVLLADPDRFLPGGDLTVRVEVMYECRDAVAIETRGDEIQAFVVKPFRKLQVAFAEKRLASREMLDADSKKTIEVVKSAFQNLSLEGQGRVDHWKKESVLMMKETFLELKEAFELYAKLQQLKDIVERTPQPLDSNDIDFCHDPFKDMELFGCLYTKSGLGPPMEQDFVSWMGEPSGVVNVSHQLARIMAIHKHLQVHWELREDKKVADRQLGQSENDVVTAHDCSIGRGIRELFYIYEETVEGNSPSPDNLQVHVCRFLKVFANVIRILTLRLYWPVCVLQQPPSNEYVGSTSAKDVDPTSVASTSTASVSSMEKHIVTDEELSKSDAPQSELWHFTVETSDQKRFQIPFQRGGTTLGSLLRSASPVFDRMLETPMVEKSSGFLKMDDVDSSTFSRFLSYLESNKVDVDNLRDCGELYRVAHKYQVDKLVLECVRKIAEMMDHVDADDVAEFSKFYGDDELMSAVEAFRFRPRATMAVWGLRDDLDVAPLSPETTWAKSVRDVPVVEKAVEAVQPEEKFDFYE